MTQKIQISKKNLRKGEDGHKVISVRMKDETLARLDQLAEQTNRSRNELINMLVDSALNIVSVTDE